MTVWSFALPRAPSAILVFSHADRHGSKRATWWGVAAFLATIVVVPLYFLRHWALKRRR